MPKRRKRAPKKKSLLGKVSSIFSMTGKKTGRMKTLFVPSYKTKKTRLY